MVKAGSIYDLRFTIYSHITNIQLQPDITVPTICFQLVREIDALIALRRCGGFFQTTPPDSLEWPVVVTRDAQLQMLLLYYLRLAQNPQSSRDKDGPRVTGAEWFQGAQFLRQLKC